MVFFNSILSVLTVFGSAPVRFLLPSVFYLVLMGIAGTEWKERKAKHDYYVMLAAFIGLCRELVLFANLRLEFALPPFEHFLSMFSGLLLGTALMKYFLPWPRLVKNFTVVWITAAVLLYIITAVFGLSFWGDMLFRISDSLLFAFIIGSLFAGRHKGIPVPPLLILAMGFFFLDEFLMIFNLASGEAYKAIYIPIRYNLHTWAIPLFIAVYWQGLLDLLKINEKKYQSLFAGAGDAVFINDGQSRILEANPLACERLGYTREELLSMTASQVDSPVEAVNVTERIAQLKKQGILTFETVHQCKDGSRIPTEVTVRQLVWNEQPAIMSICRDITERKAAEDIQRNNRANLTAIIENTLDSIWAINTNYEILYTNEVFAQAFKTSFGASLVPGVILLNAIPEPLRPGWKEKYDRAFNNERFVFEDKIDLGFIVIYIEVAVNPIVDNGKVIGASFFGRDITERKAAEQALRDSEEKLSTLFASMTEMVVMHELVFDEKGEAINYRITDCNNAFTKTTGIAKEAAAGKLATEVYHTETPPYLEEFSTVAITGKTFEYTTYFEPMDKHFSISVVSPKKNNFATITTDITGIKQIQEIITVKNAELENYLYIASHDLRSPLVNIQGFSQRLQKQTDSIKKLLADSMLAPEVKSGIDEITDKKIPNTLDFIFTNAKKMDALLNGLLQISRTGRTLMTIKQIDMNHLLGTIIGTYNFQLTEIDAAVTVENLPPCFGDESLLNQLFSNIIGNGIKYRDPDRKLTIRITAHQDFKKVVYSIGDNGIGIDSRHLEKIWNVFYRVDSTLSESGDGLGLSIVKRIAEKHHGRVWAESLPGKGSIFNIELQTQEFNYERV